MWAQACCALVRCRYLNRKWQMCVWIQFPLWNKYKHTWNTAQPIEIWIPSCSTTKTTFGIDDQFHTIKQMMCVICAFFLRAFRRIWLRLICGFVMVALIAKWGDNQLWIINVRPETNANESSRCDKEGNAFWKFPPSNWRRLFNIFTLNPELCDSRGEVLLKSIWLFHLFSECSMALNGLKFNWISFELEKWNDQKLNLR